MRISDWSSDVCSAVSARPRLAGTIVFFRGQYGSRTRGFGHAIELREIAAQRRAGAVEQCPGDRRATIRDLAKARHVIGAQSAMIEQHDEDRKSTRLNSSH